MEISVILCTYNRCHMLREALNSLAAQDCLGSAEWEVLVVDNNSQDQTREVVEDFCCRYPGRFRYLFEPQPGKSHALNSGIREAHGEILAFMDDDAKVAPDWLHNLTASLHDDQWAGAGGKIEPEWSRPAPRWLPSQSSHALAPLTVFDRGPQAGQLRENPYGANMAFRREMFEKYGGFRTDLGPRPGGKEPQKSEDSEFGRRLLAAGEKLRYEPSAVVYHPVQESRIKKQYFLNWWFDKGRSDIRAYGVRPGTKYCVAGIPFYLFRDLLASTLKWMLAFGPSRRFSNKLDVWNVAGAVSESYRQARQARKRAEDCRA